MSIPVPTERASARRSSPGSARRLAGAALLLASLALAITGLASCDGGGRGAEVWRVAIEETAGSVQDAYAQEFARLIEERSGGEVEVKVYPYGTLGTSDDITEQLRMGALQFAMASPGHLGKSIPELQVFALHFVFSDDEDVNLAALRDPAFRAAIEPLFHEKEMELLSILPEGWMVWTTDREVAVPADFEGIKIRTMTSPLLLAAYEAYGASPQAMPYGEVYSALQLNMIDAQVNPIFAIEEMSFYEVTSHLVFAHHAPFTTTFVVNQEFLEKVPPQRRALIREAARDAEIFLSREERRLNEERLRTILEKKPELVVRELSEEERAAFRARSLPVRERYRQLAGERGARILELLLSAISKAEREVGG